MDSLAVFQEITDIVTMWFSHFIVKYAAQRIEYICVRLLMVYYSSKINQHSPMNIQTNTGYGYNERLFNHKKKCCSYLWYHMDEPWKCYILSERKLQKTIYCGILLLGKKIIKTIKIEFRVAVFQAKGDGMSMGYFRGNAANEMFWN